MLNAYLQNNGVCIYTGYGVGGRDNSLDKHLSTLLWKENLNSDGLQFHQYQQNEKPSLTSKHALCFEIVS